MFEALSKRLPILLIFLLLSSCAQYIPLRNTPPQEPSYSYLYKLHPQVVLVLGSGSARGFSHAGVLKVLEENHIPMI